VGPSSGQGKKKKKDRCRANPNTIVVVDHAGKRQGIADQFEQLLEKRCTNHGYPVKHKFKDCELLMRMLCQPTKRKGGDRNKEVPKNQGMPSKDGGDFSEPDGCLMIFGCSEDDCSKRQHKVHL
jgi:hypothetical protein